MAPSRPHKPLSETTKAILATKTFARTSDHAQTPSRTTPGVPSRCRRGDSRQQRLRLQVNKNVGQDSTSSETEGSLANLFRQKWGANASEPFKHGEQLGEQGRGGHIARVDNQAAVDARPAEQSKNSAYSGGSKQPPIVTLVVNGNGSRQVKERRDLYDLNESQDDQETPQAQRSPLQMHTHEKQKSFNSNLDQEQEEQGGETNGYHVSPSNQESRAFALHIKERRRDSNTPMKTYSQNRTIAATQGGRISMGKQVVDGDSDAQDYQESEGELDTIDIEILHLGEDDHDLQFASPQKPQNASSPPSPKRPREDANSKQAEDPNNHSPQAGDWEEDDFEEPAPKKQRQSSRQIPNAIANKAALQELSRRRASKPSQEAATVQKTTAGKKLNSKSSEAMQKRTPRRLPVNELVTASERFDGSDEEDDIVIPSELPEDPILISSEEEPEAPKSRGRKTTTKVSIKLRGKGIGPINISEFRIPQAQGASRNTGQPTYSDGFVGKEAEPIGRTMPMRQHNRRQGPTQKLTLHIGELTLVAETYSGDNLQEEQSHQKPRRKAKRPVPVPRNANGAGEKDTMPMLFNSAEQQNHAKQPREHYHDDEAVQQAQEHQNIQHSHESGIHCEHLGQEAPLEAFKRDSTEGENSNEKMVIDKPERERVEPAHEKHVRSEYQDIPPEQPREPQNIRQSQLTLSNPQQKTPIAVKYKSTVQTPNNPRVCLKRQESTTRTHGVSFLEEARSPEVSRSFIQQGSFGRKEPYKANLSQPSKIVSTSRKSSQKLNREEIAAFQQLDMVTTPRPPSRTSDSDNESESESYCDVEIEEEESTEEEAEHTPESSSQEDDAEPKKKTIDPAVIEKELMLVYVEVQEENTEEVLPLKNNGKVPLREFNPESLSPQETTKPIVEQKGPPVVICARKPEHLAVPADNSRSQVTRLPQMARYALNVETANSLEGRNNGVPQQIEEASFDSSWKPSQPSSGEPPPQSLGLPQPSSSGPMKTGERVDARGGSSISRPSEVKRGENTTALPEYADDSYRPTQPISSGRLIEVSEDIDTSPTPLPSRRRVTSQRHSQSQRMVQQRRQSQSLRLTHSRQSPGLDNNTADHDTQCSVNLSGTQENNGLESQGSVELGGNQTLLRHGSIVYNNESQGSTILGATHPLARHLGVSKARCASEKRLSNVLSNIQPGAEIPETQVESEREHEFESEVPESQLSYVPEGSSYFTRASQQLQDPIPSARFSRTKSTPARPAFFGPPHDNSELMAGGIFMKEAFEYSPSQTLHAKTSPLNRTPRLPTLLEAGSSQPKSLKSLARQASLGMGTTPGTARKRMKSLPFVPPFKRIPGG